MPDFDKLQHHVRQLNDLLSAREEGLFTWNEMVGKKWKTIVDMWRQAQPEDSADSNFEGWLEKSYPSFLGTLKWLRQQFNNG